MPESLQEVLDAVADIRRRLERPRPSYLTDAHINRMPTQIPELLERLRQKLQTSAHEQKNLQLALHDIDGVTAKQNESAVLPNHLTRRSLRLLQQTRHLLNELRPFASEPLIYRDENHPSAVHYQDSVLLAEVVMRVIQSMPEEAGLQMRLASGIDVLQSWLEQRRAGLNAVVQLYSKEEKQIAKLSRLLDQLHRGELKDWGGFIDLAATLVKEAANGLPAQIITQITNDPLTFVAGHSLSVARVIARATHDADEWQARLLQPVTAALAANVGMLSVPAEILCKPDVLTADQRAIVEKHCALGARWIECVPQSLSWLAEAARDHHERLNGVGYPAGVKGEALSPLSRLLAVCEAYAALRQRRCYRPPLQPEAAMEEITALANRGSLCVEAVRQLRLQLSPYPADTAVQLENGACGLVVAICSPRHGEAGESKHVVMQLSDADGKALPYPQVADLTSAAGHAIRRSLTCEERRKYFGACYPQWAA